MHTRKNKIFALRILADMNSEQNIFGNHPLFTMENIYRVYLRCRKKKRRAFNVMGLYEKRFPAAWIGETGRRVCNIAERELIRRMT